MFWSEDKPAKDKELATGSTSGGTAYRMVMPDTPEDVDEAPFEIYTLEPPVLLLWCIPVQLGNPPLMAVQVWSRWTYGQSFSACYTKDHFYEVTDTWKDLFAVARRFLVSPIH